MSNVSTPVADASLARVVGPFPDGVNMWGITKKEGKNFTRLTHPDAEGTHLKVWPLDELSTQTIRERWGAGDYRVQWFVSDPTAEKPFLPRGTGPLFTLDAPEPPTRVAAPVQAPAPAASPGFFPPGFEQAMQFMALIDQRSGSQLERTMQLAASMAGGRSNGLDAQALAVILGQQSQQTKEMIATMQQQHEQSLAALRTELTALRGELDGDEDEDDDGRPSAAAGLAGAVAAPFIKKNQDLKSALLNYAAQNPAEVFGVLKAAPDVVRELAKLATQSAAPPPIVPQPPPTPAPVSRPRAIPARVPEQTLAPEPGLNEVLRQQAKALPTEPAPAQAEAS